MTDHDDFAAARTRLLAERERLEHTLATVRKEYEDDGPITTTGDTAADTSFADTSIGLQRELEAELGEIDAALGRIDDGTYGIDEETGEPIDPARLEAMPTARTNI